MTELEFRFNKITEAEHHPRSRGTSKISLPLIHQALHHCTHFLPLPTQMWRSPLSFLPGAKVCHAETTSRQQYTETWHSVPRSPRRFGAAESEVPFLKEKPKSTWGQNSIACTTSLWADGSSRGAPGSEEFVLGKWPDLVKSCRWSITYYEPGTVLRALHSSSCLNFTEIHEMGGIPISQVRKLRIWGVTEFDMVRQPESGGAKTWIHISENLKILIISCWAILPWLEEEIEGHTVFTIKDSSR